MSWLGRLFRPAPPGPAQPNAVVIPRDIVAALAGGDEPLQATVEAALRRYIELGSRATHDDADKLPFWLRRDAGENAEIDESLRDRVTQRRAVEGEG